MINKNFNIISKHLKKIRKSRKLSYYDISNSLKTLNVFLSENDLKNIEDNKREVKDFELIALSIILDTPIDFFFKDF